MADTDTSRVRPKDARRLLAKWVCDSWARTKEETVYNSWRHDPFSYFPDEPTYQVEYESDYEYSSDEEEDNEDNGNDIIETI